MDGFAASTITFEDLAQLNWCRLYLQAFYLSDITTGDGLRLTEEAWNGQTITLAIRNESWLRKGRPQKKDWEFWELQLSKHFLDRGTRLQCPLGEWLYDVPTWRWYFDPSKEDLYLTTGKQWFSHCWAPVRGRIRSFHRNGTPSHKPPYCHLTTTYANGDKVFYQATHHYLKPQMPLISLHSPSFCTTLRRGFTFKICWWRTMAKPLSQLYNPLMQLLSQKDRFVSAKWILEGPTRVGCIQGVIGVSGDGQS